MYRQFLFPNYIMCPSKRKEENSIILSAFEVTVYFKIDPFDRVCWYYVIFLFTTHCMRFRLDVFSSFSKTNSLLLAVKNAQRYSCLFRCCSHLEIL